MANGDVVMNDSGNKIHSIMFKKRCDALKAEYQRNGGNAEAAIKTVQETFDWNRAEREAKEEYNAKHRKNPIR